ncbi:MAG: sensor histidine kinase, partial [Gammaproteobacteria bacterium]|nr:sensor histidine kinase [Gammaproteobacteria bacterium]
MKVEQGLSTRLYREFVLQAIYITLAVVLGVFAVSFVVEDVLIKQALKGEAEFYWKTVTKRPDLALPETRNMISYRDTQGAPVPEHLQNLEPGFHQVSQPAKALAYITGSSNDRLYLVFDSGGVNYLVTWFGLVPLALVLVVIYLSLYQAYRVSR